MERKIPYTLLLTQRQSRYVSRESKTLQISVADWVRRLIDREIDRETKNEFERVDFRS